MFGYWPDAHFNGVDTFEYTITDRALTDTATVTMTVMAVEDAPVIGGDWYIASQDIPLSVSAPGVLVND